ncbi:MAG: methylenetetrahydrofolate--tRNA-(uracil(54)-C(5))-methyltransferase (FADH(2)-oxidizing) TrmFO, partial [Clostridiales bacterium]
MKIAFLASRYDKGESGGDYLNCPMTKEQYLDFHEALLSAELYPLQDFEKEVSFEGCMPVETMAQRGLDTMRYGPLKPVGLICPNGSEACAVVQLRQDDVAATMYNMVGFQTRLKRGEQERVFRMIPGLENAEFLRYGQMHRNTYLNSPRLLNGDLTFKNREDLLFAGQITGVEGYVESAACGLVAGINSYLLSQGQKGLVFPGETALGSLLHYISVPSGNFQPMNITFGLSPPLAYREKNKKLKNAALAARSLEALDKFIEQKALNNY